MAFAPQAKPPKYYRKPSPETMKANRDVARTQYKEEMAWLKENLSKLGQYKAKFLIEMYTIMVSGARKITPKMISSIRNGIEKCKKNPKYNPDLLPEAEKKFKPILEKLAMVERLCEQKGDKALGFIQSIKSFVQTNYFMTKKQMEGVNKVYKRVSEDLFGEEDNS